MQQTYFGLFGVSGKENPKPLNPQNPNPKLSPQTPKLQTLKPQSLKTLNHPSLCRPSFTDQWRSSEAESFSLKGPKYLHGRKYYHGLGFLGFGVAREKKV